MIVGFNIESIEGSRGESASGELQVRYSPKIDNVKEATVSAIEGEVAKIDFTFTVNYEAGGEVAASVEMKGNVLWKGDTEEITEVWEENEELPEDVEVPLMNDMYRKCLSQAVGIADTLNLLPPIPTPRME